MTSELLGNSKVAKCSNFLFLVIKSCFLIICLGSAIGVSSNDSINIGAIIDVDSRVGKEQKTAMIIAAESFNNISRNHKLIIHFENTSNNPIQAVSAAEKLIREEQVQVIIGLQTWEQAVLVADVGKRDEVPVLSLASAPNTHLFMQHRWPFLVPLASNSLEQINCISAIVSSYHYRKVIAIYEDNTYAGDSEMLVLLSEALKGVNAEIESHLVLPPVSSVDDPEGIVREEVEKLLTTQSRVFVVLRSSLSLATHLFREAKKMGFMGRDSVWILADSLSNLLDSVDTSFISSVQGALGTKAYYSEETTQFAKFKHEFQKKFRLQFPDEHNLEPGSHALLAYDAITAVSKAVMELGNKIDTNASMSLLSEIRSSSFTGLTGDVHFHSGALSSTSMFRIVNVVGKRYKELGFWSSKFGFADYPTFENGKRNLYAVNGVATMQKLNGLVNWPGELKGSPKGWAMPTDAKRLQIGVPGRTVFEKFVTLDWGDKTNKKKYDGFCIDIFEEVLQILEQDYALPYDFVPYNGTYDALVDHVINKTFDAVVGDVTILANRSNYVDFTHPFTESGLSMVVPAKHEPQKGWKFMKPFSRNLWIATFGVLFYTMFIIWFMEHKSGNKQFVGPMKDQLGTALWFTFSSLFFAHRETIKSNYSKIVVVMWLFLVFVLTSSYTASLTSMLTIPRIEPNVTDVAWVRRTNVTVGCDSDSFVQDYLKNIIQIQNIKTILSEDAYPGEFESGNITAAFIELPYQKVFLKEHCNGYTVVGPIYRSGGLGFVFQKGSPIARDVSRAILILLENGKLKRLEDEWLGSSMNCSSSDSSLQNETLSLQSFWGLYLISGATSTICFLIFIARLLKNSWENNVVHQNGAAATNRIKGVLDMVVELAPHLRRNGSLGLARARTFGQRWSSSRWVLASPTDYSEHFEGSTQDESKLI